MTAPLFVLFFMAMFVRWATVPGTWAAAVASTVVAVGVAYFHWFGLAFVWIMPVSLVAGIVVGALASLAPWGVRRPMLDAMVTAESNP
jgi:hypothetical protein